MNISLELNEVYINLNNVFLIIKVEVVEIVEVFRIE